jgi:isopentenyl diphosphate isomerase/L-lactate dehydrogenase-like FMN-dependent dehydrogenase
VCVVVIREDYNANDFYIEGAAYFSYRAGDGETVKAARESFAKLHLVPRAMRGVDSTCATSYFGKSVAVPLIISPTALHSLADPRGEIATATGAGNAGAIYCYNYFLASQSIDDVAKIPGEKWLHLYLFEERFLVEFAIEEALEKYKGVFSAIIVTCDHPHNRVRDTVIPYFRKLWYLALPTSLSSPYMFVFSDGCFTKNADSYLY